MLSVLKRYSVAFFILLFVILLMLFGTLGVKSFGDKMFEESGVEIIPRGEKVNP